MLRRLAFLLLCTHALACADDTSPTRTLIRFSTAAELEVPEGALLRVVGYANGLRQHEEGETLGMFPFDEGVALPVEPEENESARRFTVFAELLSATGMRISWARVRSGFVQDERREIRVEFQAGCQDPSDPEPSPNYDPDAACGSHDTCAAVDGSVACRSACFTPEPADSEAILPSVPVVCPIEDDLPVERLEHGTSYTCALGGGEPFCWSQMGVDSPLFRQASRVMTPEGRTSFAPGAEVVDITASAQVACAVLVDGTLRCGGEGDALPELAPDAHCCQVEPAGFPLSRDVASGGSFICALAEGGELFCSGRVPPHETDDEVVSPARRYDRGVAPNGWTALFAAPGTLAGLGPERLELLTGPSAFDFTGVDLPVEEVALVALSADGLCIVDVEGRLRCWGDHDPLDLGDGWRQVAMAERSLDEATRVNEHRCGIRTDGTLWCWGESEYGMLGVEPRGVISFDERVQVGTNGDWTDVSVGERVSCGIREGGHVYCWGSNQERQLGRDSSDTPIPQRVPIPGW